MDSNAGSGRPDARTTLFGTERHEHVLVNMEIQVLRSTNRITLEITLEEWSAIEQKTSLSFFQQNQGHQIAVQEHLTSRRCGESSQTVFESSARYETMLMMELRAAQMNNEPTVEQRERDILFRIGNEAQTAVRQQRAHMLTEHEQLVLTRGMPKENFYGVR